MIFGKKTKEEILKEAGALIEQAKEIEAKEQAESNRIAQLERQRQKEADDQKRLNAEWHLNEKPSIRLLYLILWIAQNPRMMNKNLNNTLKIWTLNELIQKFNLQTVFEEIDNLESENNERIA